MKRMVSALLSSVSGFRNCLYDKEWIEIYRAQRPVISVGNLTMGGTGKTPFVEMLLRILNEKKLQINVVSRSYGGNLKLPSRVDLTSEQGPTLYGDEVWMLAQRWPQNQFFSGPSKSQTIKWIEQNLDLPDLYIIDDGFQHRRVHRDFNVVLIDATTEFVELEVFPVGRGREDKSSISRADMVVLTKVNWIAEDLRESHILQWKRYLAQLGVSGIQLALAEYHMRIPEINGKRVLLISGIARPEALLKQVQLAMPIKLQHEVFADHYNYNARDIARLRELAKDYDLVLTTEKDRVKFLNIESVDWTQVIDLQCHLVSGMGVIDEFCRTKFGR